MKLMINQLKAQLKKFWRWLVILIMGGVVLANIITPLNPEGIPFIIVNGERIEFPYTDDNTGENLIIRTDRETYGGWDESIVYAMVENKSGKGQAINLQVFFSDESKSVAEISRLKLDVPYEVDVPDFKTVDYDCSITEVSSTTEKTITEKKTCQRDEQIGSHKETRYRDEWQEQTLEDFSIHENNILIASQEITEKDKKGFVAEKKIQTPVLADEITYYRIKIKFPSQTKDEFFIEAIGSDGAYGHLDPWYNASWLYKKEISINPAVIDTDLANFPVLVALASSTNFDFTKAREDGFDVIFTDDDEDTLLDFERERYSTTTEQAEFWVEIPSVSSSTAATTTFYMYYGNSGASDISSSTAPWDANYLMVYHLKEDNTGTTIYDSTSNANTAAKKANAEPSQTEAKIGKGQSFDGSNDYINLPDLVTFGASGTLEAWVKPGAVDTNDYIVNIGNAATNNMATMKMGASSGNVNMNYAIGGSYLAQLVFGTISTADWHYMAFPFATNDFIGYLDTTTATDTAGTTGNFSNWAGDYISTYDGTNQSFNGMIDEVRISNIRRTNAWIKATYNSGNNTLLAYGAEESSVVPVEPQMEVIIIE